MKKLREAVTCFENALQLAENETDKADIYFNIGENPL